MKRVIGLGGIFFKTKNPQHTREWYQKHLGIKTDQYGATFEWRKADNPDEKGYTVWSIFKEDTDYFKPSDSELMVNYRVEKPEALLGVVKN